MSAIDFSKITKTVDGLDCYYIGQRTSGGKIIHRFAVVNDVSELINYYDEQGQRIEFSGAGGWLVSNSGHQIIKPPKIVEVTRWVGLYEKSHAPGEYLLDYALTESLLDKTAFFRGCQQHTFRFEVPND